MSPSAQTPSAAAQQRLLVQERGAAIILKGVGIARMTRGCVLWRVPIHPLACQRRGREKNDTSAQCYSPSKRGARPWCRRGVVCVHLAARWSVPALNVHLIREWKGVVVLAESVDCAVSACV
jgi:hypothetical protein